MDASKKPAAASSSGCGNVGCPCGSDCKCGPSCRCADGSEKHVGTTDVSSSGPAGVNRATADAIGSAAAATNTSKPAYEHAKPAGSTSGSE